MHLLRTLGSTALFERAATGERHVAIHAKRLALLLFLARGGQGPFLRRDVLLALLWPDANQEHGRGALRQALTGLRKQLGPHAIVTQGEDQVGLAPEAVTCDATEFERTCVAQDHIAASVLYSGDFAAGFHVTGLAQEFEQWVDGERSRLRRLAVLSARGAATLAEQAGRSTEAVTWARRSVELAPEDEAVVTRLITLLDSTGDRSGALAAYNDLERRLAEEYSVEPSPETRALIDAVRVRRGPHHPFIASAEPPETARVVDRPVSALADTPAAGRGVSPPRRRLLQAGAIGAALMLAFAAVSAWIGRPAVPTGEVVAIVPFRVSASDSGLGWLREGMVELLTIRLSGEGGMGVAEPGRLLTAWHRKVPAGRSDVPEEAVWSVAAGVGAGRIIQGSVTGDSRSVVLSAWVLMPGGRVVARATAEGPPDSLPFLVDRLAVRLLGLNAGIEGYRLASFTSTSLPAIRAFLAGRAAFRSGRYEGALQRFIEAVELDSGFALAALEAFRTAGWVTSAPDAAIAARRASAGRDRLSPADRALLDVMQEQWINAPVMFAKWNRVTAAYPERPESWYGLGDAYYHWGGLAGIDGSLERAEEAFRRGWQLDSAAEGRSALAMAAPLIAEPMSHMVELAQLRGDTAEVRRLVLRVMAADSGSELASYLRWHLAQVEGDSARRAFWDGIGTAPQEVTVHLARFFAWTGIGAEDYPLMVAESRRRLRLHDPGYGAFVTRVLALNGGRPSDVPATTEFPGYLPREGLRARIRGALSWGGDSAAASDAGRLLSRSADGPLEKSRSVRRQYQDICTVGQWRAAHGDLQAAEAASRKLQAAWLPDLTGSDSSSFFQFVELCAALLDASRASALGRPKAREAIAVADSLARTNIFEVCCGEGVTDANLLLARLWERAGDLPRALSALRRRSGGFGLGSLYQSSFFREEGRLAALTGDTAGAVRAYRQYLALRYDLEPVARPEVERVRRDLAALSPRVALGR